MPIHSAIARTPGLQDKTMTQQSGCQSYHSCEALMPRSPTRPQEVCQNPKSSAIQERLRLNFQNVAG